MLSLLPSELWDFGPGDFVRGLNTALSRRHSLPEHPIQIPGLGPCLPIRSARSAIAVALKALEVRDGARVGVPLYCCPVVFKAIEAAGCRARFIDVDPGTYCLSPTDLAAKRSEVDAVIAVHMFGNLCDVGRVRDAVPGKPVIEDCAQALGSRFDGRPAGSFGEIAAFSFHSGKYVSVGEGGALFASRPELRARLSGFLAALPRPDRLGECRHVAATFLRSSLRSKPLWGLVGARLWDVYSEKVSYTSQSPMVLARIFETDRAATIRRLPRLGSWIERQRSNAACYARTLAVSPGMLCEEAPRAFYNRLQYPLLMPTPPQCSAMVEYLREHGISTARPYRNIAAVAAAHHGYAGDCPQAERIASTVLVIPCNHSLTAADVERIATCVNRGWAQIGPQAAQVTVPFPVPRGTSPA